MQRRDPQSLPIGQQHGVSLMARIVSSGRRISRLERKFVSLAKRYTAIPPLPNDGQIIHYQTDAMKTAGVVWQFRYNSETGGSYPWEFVGGGTMEDSTGLSASFETTTSVTYTDLATVGPSLDIPLDGQYLITTYANMLSSAAGTLIYAAVDPGGGASDINATIFTGNTQAVSNSSTALLVVTAGTTVRMKYRVAAGTGSYRHRRMTIVPIRVRLS